ncbi:hypothetical protein [Peijinzhouia sedimentorum]|tara:strand:- start:304 stop:453 length:150 start_codon:yes stop_codon:yes gene_type:complete
MKKIPSKNPKEYNEDDIPVFKSWSGWYWFIMIVLAVLILLFYWFTKYYS